MVTLDHQPSLLNPELPQFAQYVPFLLKFTRGSYCCLQPRTLPETVKEEDKWKYMLKWRSEMRFTENVFLVPKTIGIEDKQF